MIKYRIYKRSLSLEGCNERPKTIHYICEQPTAYRALRQNCVLGMQKILGGTIFCKWLHQPSNDHARHIMSQIRQKILSFLGKKKYFITLNGFLLVLCSNILSFYKDQSFAYPVISIAIAPSSVSFHSISSKGTSLISECSI